MSRKGKVFAGAAVQKAAFDGVSGGEGDGVDKAIQSTPGFGKGGENGVDFCITRDVAGQEDAAAEFGTHFFDARF